jgi:hypothetical protein
MVATVQNVLLTTVRTFKYLLHDMMEMNRKNSIREVTGMRGGQGGPQFYSRQYQGYFFSLQTPSTSWASFSLLSNR